jgi:prophage tail gpP-like protein
MSVVEVRVPDLGDSKGVNVVAVLVASVAFSAEAFEGTLTDLYIPKR